MPRNLLWTLGFILFIAVLLGITKGNNVTLEIPEQTVYIGDKVLLKCHSGPSALYKNGLQLRGKKKQHRYYVEMNGSSSSDDVYFCENQEGRSTAKKLKIIERRRKILLIASKKTISDEGRVTLTCDIEDYEGPYIWTRHDSALDRIQRNSQNVTVAEAGTYSCCGSNDQLLTESSNTVIIMECNCSSNQVPYTVVGILSAVHLLIVLYFIKGRCFGRTQKDDQKAASDVMTKDDESQQYVYMSPMFGLFNTRTMW